jgi:hypothetical protein
MTEARPLVGVANELIGVFHVKSGELIANVKAGLFDLQGFEQIPVQVGLFDKLAKRILFVLGQISDQHGVKPPGGLSPPVFCESDAAHAAQNEGRSPHSIASSASQCGQR